jgi:predicted nucleic acid-binding protein
MAADARREGATQARLILDAGATIAIARGNPKARLYLEQARRERMRVVIPPGAIAETVRGDGPRDAAVNRVINDVDEVPPVTEAIARSAGALLARHRSHATIDALLVAEGVAGGDVTILTGDPSDIRKLATGQTNISVLAI